MKHTISVLVAATLLSNTAAFAQPVGDWQRVEGLTPGRVVVVADDSGASIRGRILRADAESILLYAPTIDTRQLKPIERLARDRAHLLGRVDRVPLEMPDERIRISADGISKKEVRIAAFGDVFHIAPRAGIVSVVEPKDERGSGWPAVFGTAVGAAAGFFGGIWIAFSSETKATAAAPIGGGILGGIVGHRLGRPVTHLVIYLR